MLKKLVLIAVASSFVAAAARWFVRRVEVEERLAERKLDVQRWEDEGGLVPVNSERPAVS